MTEPLWRLSATELHRRYRDGSLMPLSVARGCLERLEAVNSRVNAVIARRDDAFLADATAATERFAQGRPLSPVDGIPVTVKDSLFTHDMPTTWGTQGLSGFMATHDETAAARARAGGALVLGKTNVPEFALEGYTANPLFGVTRNPWSLALTPGGSSGGAVAAVATGIAPLAIAQDGGGSIRRPASHAGLVGLKPSLGRVAREHVLPSLLLDFEVIGPIARTVADAKLLFDVMSGPSPLDRHSLAAAHAGRHAPDDTARSSPLRILYVERFGSAPLDAQVAGSVGAAVEAIAKMGHRVTRGALPLDLDFFAEAWPQIGQAGLAALFEQHPEWRELASERYVTMAEQGRAIPASRLWQILEQVKALRRASAGLFTETDLVVMPSAAALPWEAERAYPETIDGQAVGPRGHAAYTGWVNAAGLPGLALPCAPSKEGLPIGMQVIGPYGADDSLLRFGEAFESVQPWAHRWPDLPKKDDVEPETRR
jgi:aspartyl-tRNA(Asn)/glutamyl-tRNA(Gln) amidotransferase subunit A